MFSRYFAFPIYLLQSALNIETTRFSETYIALRYTGRPIPKSVYPIGTAPITLIFKIISLKIIPF